MLRVKLKRRCLIEYRSNEVIRMIAFELWGIKSRKFFPIRNKTFDLYVEWGIWVHPPERLFSDLVFIKLVYLLFQSGLLNCWSIGHYQVRMPYINEHDLNTLLISDCHLLRFIHLFILNLISQNAIGRCVDLSRLKFCDIEYGITYSNLNLITGTFPFRFLVECVNVSIWNDASLTF